MDCADIVLQTIGAPCSLLSFTDTDGVQVQEGQPPWTDNPIGCGIASGNDHQTVGGGPFVAPLPPGTPPQIYPRAVHYCAGLAALSANCAFSAAGGLAFGPAVTNDVHPVQCLGIHGHVVVGPDGTVYVPFKSCTDGYQHLVVSADSGATWTHKDVTSSTSQPLSSTYPIGKSDPSVAIGPANTAYFCFEDADGHPKVAVSHNKGDTWSSAYDVGAAFNIQNSRFPAAVVGDDNRAACAFLGTPTAGDDQSVTFTGAWELYVAFTYDGGTTWTTVDATPGDPVQRGCIWMQGGSTNECRNLYDFMGAAVGRDGRVYVGYADGCLGDCTGPSGTPSQSRSRQGTIARQASGLTLFSQYDPDATHTTPLAPEIGGRGKYQAASLAWTLPRDGGSEVIGYKLYRSIAGIETLLASLPASDSTYRDTNLVNGVTHNYRVTAVNALGEGASSPSVAVVPQAPTAPGAPRGLTGATNATSGSAVLKWFAPADDGLSPLLNYTVYRNTGTGYIVLGMTDAATLYFKDPMWSSGYQYEVSALSSIGEGPRSDPAALT